MRGQIVGRLFWGLMIVVAGVVFLLNQTGHLQMDIGELIGTYWPVILIVVGLQGLVGGWRHGGGVWGGMPALVGVIFLAHNLGWVEWSIGQMFATLWPVALILFGLSIIFRPGGSRRGRPDDWREYPSSPPPGRHYPPQTEVPPAPPLHPDPFSKEAPEADAVRNGEAYAPPAPGQVPPPPEAPRDPRDMRERMRQQRKEYRHHYRHMRHEARKRHERVEWWNSDPGVQTRSGFIGDIHLGQDYWELKPMNISHFIGDTVLDLTKAQIPTGETKITISSFIGDVKVFIPNDYEVGIHVMSSAFIGDAAVLDRKEGGMFQHMNVETPYFPEADKKIQLVVSTFIGDVRVTKVG